MILAVRCSVFAPLLVLWEIIQSGNNVQHERGLLGTTLRLGRCMLYSEDAYTWSVNCGVYEEVLDDTFSYTPSMLLTFQYVS
jgi:hypothetical protein